MRSETLLRLSVEEGEDASGLDGRGDPRGNVGLEVSYARKQFAQRSTMTACLAKIR
jgi:hypothetical protein